MVVDLMSLCNRLDGESWIGRGFLPWEASHLQNLDCDGKAQKGHTQLPKLNILNGRKGVQAS